MTVTETADAATATGPQTEVPRLNTFYAYLTQGCNLACRHCYLGPKFDPDGDKEPVLAYELFETAINEGLPLGLTGVKLSGGEPLLHPRVFDMIELMKRHDLRLTVETNGVLCTPEAAEAMASAKNPYVSVSIDGADAEMHEYVRGVKGCFDQACRAVRNLAAAGLRPQVIMALMNCNLDHIEGVIRLAEELGAGSVKFNLISYESRGEALHKQGHVPTVTEYIKLGEWVERDLAKKAKVKLVYSHPAAFRPLSSIASGRGCGSCGVVGILGLIPSGHYALCGVGEVAEGLVFGKIGEDRLEDVWRNTPLLNEAREGIPDRFEGVCSRCVMRKQCIAYCVAETYYRTGGLWAPFRYCEEAERLGLFPESRLEPTSHSATAG